MTERTCSVEGCERRHNGHGLCCSHLRQARERGYFGGIRCAGVDCDRFAVARGLCSLHYQRFTAHGDPNASVKPYRVIAACTVASCGQEHFGKGLCRTHYGKLYRHGDPLAPVVPLSVKCQVCDHPEVARIDEKIASGISGPSIAAEFGLGSKRAVYLHRDNHIGNPEWHAKRAAWWIAELAALKGETA